MDTRQACAEWDTGQKAGIIVPAQVGPALVRCADLQEVCLDEWAA